MTLLQLRYFSETYHTGSMQKASEKLNVSQSAISIAIRSLEKELGCPLFDRTTRGLELNEAGEDFLTRSEEILRQIDSIPEDFKKYSGKTPLIRIGMPPLVSTINWPELFPLLSETFPNALFENTLKTRHTLIELVRSRQIEAAIIPARDPESEFPGLAYHVLRPGYRQMAVMSIEHPLAANHSLTYGQLVHEPLIAYKEGESKLESLRRIYAGYGVELPCIQVCTQLSTLISLIQRNVGIAYLSAEVAQDYPDVVCIPVSDSYPKGFIYLVWNKPDSKLLEKVRRVLIDHFSRNQAPQADESLSP